MDNQIITILLLFIGISISCFSQENEQKSGILLHFGKPIHGAHILNQNTSEGTSSQNDGTFTIRVKLNDTLMISHVNYKTKTIINSQENHEKSKWTINLEALTNELDTVIIKSHDLTGLLNVDSKSQPKVQNKDSTNSEILHIVEVLEKKDKLFIANGKTPIYIQSNPFGSPTLKSSISFGFKDVKLKKEFRLKKEFHEILIKEFGPSYFIETLGIPEESIYHFITYCEFKNIRELYYSNNIIKVLTIMEAESIEYLKIK